MNRESRGWALALTAVLLAYPRGFRRHFGSELRADFARAASTATTAGRLRWLAAQIGHGLAERKSAAIRWVSWPSHRPHLYEPSGRRAMFWDNVRSDLRFTLRQAT